MLPGHGGPGAFGWAVYFPSGYMDSKLLKWPLEQVRVLGTSANPPDRRDPRVNLGQCRVWGGEDGDRTAPQLGVLWGCRINRGGTWWVPLRPSASALGLGQVRPPAATRAFAEGLVSSWI